MEMTTLEKAIYGLQQIETINKNNELWANHECYHISFESKMPLSICRKILNAGWLIDKENETFYLNL